MKTPFHKRISRVIRGQLRSRVLSNHGIGVVAATRNGIFVLDPGDFNVARQLLDRGEYDWREITLLTRLVSSTSNIVFAGAHVGALLIPIVRAARATQVVAFEPSPRNFRALQMNLRLNEIEGVAVQNAAVGAEPGRIRFTENRINTGNSRVSLDGGEIEVELTTLDGSISCAWDGLDLLVMDVEGYELNAMLGAKRVLAMTKRLYVEFAPDQLRQQGSEPEEFVNLVCTYFNSAFVLGSDPRFLGADECAKYLLDFSTRRGRLLNLLFTRDPDLDQHLLGL